MPICRFCGEFITPAEAIFHAREGYHRRRQLMMDRLVALFPSRRRSDPTTERDTSDDSYNDPRRGQAAELNRKY